LRPSFFPSRIYLPASLRSTGITPFPRYYGRSDSCPVGAWRAWFRSVPSVYQSFRTAWQMGTRPCPVSLAIHPRPGQVSWLHVPGLEPTFRLQSPEVPDHRVAFSVVRVTGFRHRPLAETAGYSGFAIQLQARRHQPAESSSYPTDHRFTSGCSPPHLLVTQLPSVTSPRTWTWRGFSPLGPSTLAIAQLPATWPATFHPKTHYAHWFCDAKFELTATTRTHRHVRARFTSSNSGGHAIVVAMLWER
jgi:hypothetical protein